jgi:hypothetical protein
MRSLRGRLQDILDAIAQIEPEYAKGRAAFNASRLIQVWMVQHLPPLKAEVQRIWESLPAE